MMYFLQLKSTFRLTKQRFLNMRGTVKDPLGYLCTWSVCMYTWITFMSIRARTRMYDKYGFTWFTNCDNLSHWSYSKFLGGALKMFLAIQKYPANNLKQHKRNLNKSQTDGCELNSAVQEFAQSWLLTKHAAHPRDVKSFFTSYFSNHLFFLWRLYLGSSVLSSQTTYKNYR